MSTPLRLRLPALAWAAALLLGVALAGWPAASAGAANASAPVREALMFEAVPLAAASAVPEQPESIELSVGKSVVIESAVPLARVSLAAPQTADILLLSPRQVYLTGKAPGETNLLFWDRGNRVIKAYTLIVAPDLGLLKVVLHRALPAEKGIGVFAAREAVALSGMVSSPLSLERALALAETVAPGKVVNMLQVGGVQQVLLEVKVAEMSRSVMKRFGFNFTAFLNGDFVYSFLNNMVYLDNQNGPLPITPFADAGNLYVTDSINGLFRFHSGRNVFTGFLDALKEDGLVKILAEPNLICLSGRSADFLAGGEIPVPVPQGLGTTAIEYKRFGVSLTFKPTVLGPTRIGMEVGPEVSELDYSNAVNVNGFLIPGLSTRRASTVVELEDGQSFAVAGLFKDSVREVVDKFPGLGEVPVLGSLFRSSSFLKNESELVIIVTPHLVKPLDQAAVELPTDAYVEPTDAEFYLYGAMQGDGPARTRLQAAAPRAGQPAPGVGSGMEGEFGHLLPAD